MISVMRDIKCQKHLYTVTGMYLAQIYVGSVLDFSSAMITVKLADCDII